MHYRYNTIYRSISMLLYNDLFLIFMYLLYQFTNSMRRSRHWPHWTQWLLLTVATDAFVDFVRVYFVVFYYLSVFIYFNFLFTLADVYWVVVSAVDNSMPTIG